MDDSSRAQFGSRFAFCKELKSYTNHAEI
jgi:magnesium-transporting ATPase (P-type)